MPNNASGPACYVEIGGVEYEARDFAWGSSVLQLSGQWSVTLPAPEGRILATTGETFPADDVLELGARVRFYESDPAVEGGVKLLKMTGRLWQIDDEESPEGGYALRLSGPDLGVHLTSGHARVFTNLRGVKWKTFLQRNVLDSSLGWGFEGVRWGNVENKNLRLGRALIAAQIEPAAGSIQPRFQIDVGQSLGPLLQEFAKRERYLMNVSADGWIQFFRPDYDQPALYTFRHASRGDELGATFNNVMRPRLRRSAEGLYTRVECWSSVIRPSAAQDSENPNEGRYRGTYQNLGSLPFARLCTFSDPEQIGQSRVDARAKWMWQRERFNSWEYTFTTVGHSQNGTPYEPDTMCELVDDVRGLSGRYYVTDVKPSRILARPGFNRGGRAGTLTDITVRLPDLLGA